MEEKRLEHPEERQDEKQEKKKQYPVTRRDFYGCVIILLNCGFLTGDADKSAHPQGSAKHEQQMPEYRIADVEQHQ